MSSDDYMYVDYLPGDPRGEFAVTRGFDSDEETPVPDERTVFFEGFVRADAYAALEWTEYGVRYSVAHDDYMRALLRKLEERA